MTGLLTAIMCFIFAAAMAEGMDDGKWVASDGLHCNATCGQRHPLAPGRNAEDKHIYVRAAKAPGEGKGMRAGYSIRQVPSTCTGRTGFNCGCKFRHSDRRFRSV